jgi:alkyldihydroxyacetonephosphate synthase
VIPAPPGTDSIRNDLARLVAGGKASSSDPDRVAYARDLWPRHQIATRAGNPAVAPPAVIVWPSNTEELSSVIAYAAARSIPVVPYGAGSGVCGGVLPTTDTVLIDMKMMRSLKTIDRARLTCDADAGMIGQHLEDDLGAAGFTLGHFPSSIYCSTLGGWVAGRSAGQCSGRYGKIEDMVLGLTVVDGTGRVLRAERGGDNSALLPLFIGSEGILGVVTEARLRIAPAPPCRRFASYLFPSTETGLDAIRRIYQAGLRPAVARLYDPFDSMIARRGGLRTEHEAEPKPKRTEAKPGLGLRALVQALRAPGMLNPLIADAELREARAICSRYDAQDTGEGPAKHWLGHRHSVSYRQSPLFTAGAFIDTMEVAATWSRLLPMYHAVRSALSPHVFVMAHFSHAYPDGASIYFTFAGAARDDHACELAYDRAWKAALKAVVAAGGTLSHHHGVGRSKAPAMRSEQGNAIDVVRELKRVMDPKGIFNRGALIPDLDEHTPLGPVAEAE